MPQYPLRDLLVAPNHHSVVCVFSLPTLFATCFLTAEMKLKKNNFVEQNEIRRENTFVSWTPNASNSVAMFFMCVVFPVVVYKLSKAEMEWRDVNVSKLEKPRPRI